MSFNEAGIELEFTGKGVEEKVIVKSCNDSKYQLEIGKEIYQLILSILDRQRER